MKEAKYNLFKNRLGAVIFTSTGYRVHFSRISMLIDIVYIILVIVACIKGIRKGFIIAIFSVLGFIAGLAAALKLSSFVANRLSIHINTGGKWLPVISFIFVFLVVALLVNLAGRLIEKSFSLVMLGWANRLGGMLLYIFLYSIIFSVFLFYAVQLNIIKISTIQASNIYPYIQSLGPRVINSIGTIIPVFKDMFDQLQQFFGGVSDKMQH
ncbi:MAG TPA: CvpA family protein [Ferruginibacter sp.]|nr:CvpA family protein [Ferruginibacter sp.]